jgi:thiamine biosynthesis lipoprotein
VIYTADFKAMGCHMLAALEYSTHRAKDLLSRVPEWFEAWEASLSRFRPDSELNQLNNSPGMRVPVSQILWEVFQASLEAEKHSGGLVTPAVLEAVIAAGYTSSFDQLPLTQAGNDHGSRPLLPLQNIEYSPQDHSICLPVGLSLDFGGIAKGWAAHQAMNRLKNYGPALVNAGGDIAISGLLPGGEPWLVGIDDPLHPGASLGTLRLGRCGVGTSGKDYRHWMRGEVWKHHIIDPRTGEPAETDILNATVIAPTIIDAEMAAKVILILGSQAGLEWLETHPAFTGMLVTEDGHIVYGPSFKSYLLD